MKILSIGLDETVLLPDSRLAERVIDYGNLVEKYTVFVPAAKESRVELSENVTCFGISGANKIVRLFNIYRGVRGLLAQESFDIITCQDQYFLGLLSYCLSRLNKIGFEVQVHGWEKARGLRMLIAKFVLPKADAVRTVSERMRGMLVKEFNVKSDKITVVPILTKTVPLHKVFYKEKRDDFIFLTVGRFVRVKNISLQIKALFDVVKRYPRTKLWIAGSGEEEESLRSLVNELGLVENVKFWGWLNKDDLYGLYAKADCFLLTSKAEGWGVAVVEAASHMRPIIMMDVGLAGELIKDSESGLIISDRKESLVEAMLKIINDSDLRKRLSEGARKAVEQLPAKEQTLNLYLRSWKKAKKK